MMNSIDLSVFERLVDHYYPENDYIFLMQVNIKGAEPQYLKIVAANEREAMRALRAYGPDVRVVKCLESYREKA